MGAYFASVWRGSDVSQMMTRVRDRPAGMFKKVEARIKSQLQGLTAFLDGLVVYVLSREWHDMFSIYIFRLQPVPHCSEEHGVRSGFFGFVRLVHHDIQDAAPTCIAEADARTQAVCVLELLAIAAAVHGLGKRFAPPSVSAAISSIAGTTVGWAAGDAAIRLLQETAPVAEDGSYTNASHDEISFALITTGVAVLAMLLLEPFTVYALVALGDRAAEKCCGSGGSSGEGEGVPSPGGSGEGSGGSAFLANTRYVGSRLVDYIEEAMLAVTHLTGRAVTMVVLMVWTYVSQTELLMGLSPEQRGGPLQLRLQLLWSISLTLLMALITEQLVMWRQHLEHIQQAHDLEDEEELIRATSPESLPNSSPECSRSGTPPSLSHASSAPTPASLPPRWSSALPPSRGPSEADKAAEEEEEEATATTSAASAAARRPPRAAPAATSMMGGVGGASCSSCSFSTAAEGRGGDDDAELSALAVAPAVPQTPWERFVEQLAIWRDMSFRTLLEALRRMLSLTEQLAFFATGWSWTYVFFPLSSHASFLAASRNGAVALSLTSLAVVLIVLLPGEKLGKNRSGRITIDNGLGPGLHGISGESVRMSIVKQTLTSSSTFFVGWAWVVFFRDLAALSGQTALNVHAALNYLPSQEYLVGLEAASEVQERDNLIAFVGSLGGVLLFGPILSVTVLWLKVKLLEQFAALGTGTADDPQAMMNDVLRLQRATVRAKLARLGMIESRPRGGGGAPGLAEASELATPLPPARAQTHQHRWTIGHTHSLPPEAELLKA